jgi:hypothetical protein
MADFNIVHYKSLPDEGELRDGETWTIRLREPLLRITDFDYSALISPAQQQICWIVQFRQQRGKLIPASDTDRILFREWKTKHANTPNEDF